MSTRLSTVLIGIALLLFGLPITAAPVASVEVCHFPPNNLETPHTIKISEKALSAHLAHGDLPEACNSLCATICDDGDACTIDDVGDCEENGCPADRDLIDCSDGLSCTVDSCDSASGCTSTPVICEAPDLCTVSTCAEPEGVCLDTSVSCPDGESCNPSTGACSPIILWFVTNERWRGHYIGGLSGADEKCNAAGADLDGGPFTALLSDSTTDARDRLPIEGRIMNIQGQVLVDDVSDLFPLPEFGSLGLDANLDPEGVPQSGLNRGEGAWWGSDINGVKYDVSRFGSNWCENWTFTGSARGVAVNIDIQEPSYSVMVNFPGCLAGNPGFLICFGPVR